MYSLLLFYLLQLVVEKVLRSSYKMRKSFPLVVSFQELLDTYSLDPGAGLGYADNNAEGFSGIQQSIAVEFDFVDNSIMNDPNNNHISVHTRGMLYNSANEDYSIGCESSVPYMNDGNVHYVSVSYLQYSHHMSSHNLICSTTSPVFCWKFASAHGTTSLSYHLILCVQDRISGPVLTVLNVSLQTGIGPLDYGSSAWIGKCCASFSHDSPFFSGFTAGTSANASNIEILTWSYEFCTLFFFLVLIDKWELLHNSVMRQELALP